MRKLLVLIVVLVVGYAENARACRFRRCHSPYHRPVVLILTPDIAKQALLEMMRSGTDGWFKPEIVDEMAKMRIEGQEDGWFDWGGIPVQAIPGSLYVRHQAGPRCQSVYIRA